MSGKLPKQYVDAGLDSSIGHYYEEGEWKGKPPTQQDYNSK